VHIRRIWLDNIGPFNKCDLELPSGTDPTRADVVLLVGPNGSGKTTLLLALATALSGENQLGRRINIGGAVALALHSEGEDSAILSHVPTHDVSLSMPPWLNWKSRNGRRSAGGLVTYYFGHPWSNDIPTFAYEATRTFAQPRRELVITEDASDPLFQSAFMGQGGGEGAFEQWIANTRTKLALAREDGDDQAADRYAHSVAVVEKGISDVIGDSFSLRVSREPLEVRGVINDVETPLHLLPDGLRSALAWLGDILRRLNRMAPQNGTSQTDASIIVLLDEIDAHLHPKWQRSILGVAERLLPDAQIIASTHSPYVVQSASDACVVKLGSHGEKPEIVGAQNMLPIDVVLDDILGVNAQYGAEISTEIQHLVTLRDAVLAARGDRQAFDDAAARLAEKSESLSHLAHALARPLAGR
jgi:predicted ATP-binding protein involved in virulence